MKKKGQEGMVMVVALMLLAVLSVTGAMVAEQARIDILIARNEMFHKKAFYTAEAGINTALVDMDNLANEFTNPDWEVRLNNEDYGYDKKYDFIVYHKVNSEGNVVMWGDYPIEIIDSLGFGPDHAQSNIMAEVRKDIKIEKVPAPLYADLNLESNGVSTEAMGEYDTSCDPPMNERVFDVVTTGDAAIPFTASDYPDDHTGPWDERMDDQPKYPVQQVFDKLKPMATTVIASNNIELGSEDNATGIYQLVEADGGDVKVNNINGYGILLVEGPLEMELGGNIEWHGIIICTGDARFNGGGSKQIYGAFLGGRNVLLNGSVDFMWDCHIMELLYNTVNRYRLMSWKEM